MPENSPQPLAAEFIKLLPTVILSLLIAFGTSWWNVQSSQSETRFRMEAMEAREKTNAESIAALSAASQQNAIRMAELGKDQNFILDQIKEIKGTQQELKQAIKR